MQTLPKKLPPNKTTAAPAQTKLFGEVAAKQGHRTMIYGTGGIGKTTIVCRAPGKTAYQDIENSLPILQSQFKDQGVKMPAVLNAPDFPTLRAALNQPGWDDIKNIAIEITRLEEMAVATVLKTIPMNGDKLAKRIEDYGYGKGYRFVYDVMLPLFHDLDKHAKAGRNVFLIAHQCIKTVPNPSGNDWIRYEPRLQDKDNCNIRARAIEWCDHVLFYSYDVEVSDDDEKGKGGGSKTIYTKEMPHFVAKSRVTDVEIPIASDDSTDVWSQILK